MKEIRVPDVSTILRNAKLDGARNGHHALAMYAAGRLDRSMGQDPQRSYTTILPEPDKESSNSDNLGLQDMIELKEGLDAFGLSKLYSGTVGRLNDVLEVKALELSRTGVNFTGREAEEDFAHDHIETAELYVALQDVLGSVPLKPKEKRAVIERFWNGRMLKEIGDEMNISGERVRQIIQEALKKIRQSENFAKLEAHYR